MATSGTYAFDPTVVDIVLDAFDRIQIRPAAITPDHMFSARRSLNQVQSRWSNRGINLWSVDEVATPLVAGVQEYNVAGSTVTMLETWIRTYNMEAPEDEAPYVYATNLSTSFDILIPSHTLQVDSYFNVFIPISIGGVVISGFYKVTAVVSEDRVTFTAADAATATVEGGDVPSYTTALGVATVIVTLDDHGYFGGESYTVSTQTLVGGLTLIGDYTVVAIIDDDHFTIEAVRAATSTETVFQNDSQTQIAQQSVPLPYRDQILSPLSRTDWASISNKTQTMDIPTSYWFDRTNPPTVTLWGAPLMPSPQELRYFRMRQLADADPSSTQTADIPYRFQEALCAALAYHLAIKWKPDSAEALKAYAEECWQEAADEDRERVPLNLMPQLSSYYR